MSQATEDLAKYRAAETAILKGQEVAFDNRRLRFPDLALVQAKIKELEQRVAREQAAAAGVSPFRSVARMD